jgi:putative salt-induced outer membrane protein YdiY
MKTALACAALAICIAIAAVPAVAHAQGATAPLKIYTGSFGAGLAITGGNTATRNFDLTFDLTRDPRTRNVIKANALYIRSHANGVATADRLALGFRDEYSPTKRIFVYAALPYLRDPFKEISYLINPQGGVGYKLVATDKNTLALNGGFGAVWEKDTGIDVKTSGTVNAGESYSCKLSDKTSITQVFTALWKTSDFNDAFYHTGIALVTSITKRIQLKVEFLDDYKKVTPNASVKNNDTAFITSFLFKF